MSEKTMSKKTIRKTLENVSFRTGIVSVSKHVNILVDGQMSLLEPLYNRHIKGDWGDVDDEDWETNNRSLRNGSRLLSVYELNEETIWIITEADREHTTFLLPSEY